MPELMCSGLEYRFKDHNDDTANTWENWYSIDGVDNLLLATYDTPSAVNSGYMLGQQYEKFHQRVKKGELLCHTHFEHFERKGSFQGQYDINWTAGGHLQRSYAKGTVVFGGYFMDAGELISKYFPDDLHKELVQAAAAKIMAESHDTLTFLAELASVKRMFKSAVNKLLTLRVPPGFHRFSLQRDVKANWLEGRYGWRTFLYDLEDLDKAIRSLGGYQTRYSGAKTLLHEYESPSITYPSDGGAYYQKTVTDSVTINHKGSVTADIVLPPFSFNPIVTGWELIPYSFVIDWLINVGRSLQAVSLVLTQAKYSASVGFKLTVVRYYERVVTSWKAGYSGSSYGYGMVEHVLKYRTPCAVPLLPQTKIRLNEFKVMDLIALLYGLKKR